jgi:hypothetical protein
MPQPSARFPTLLLAPLAAGLLALGPPLGALVVAQPAGCVRPSQQAAAITARFADNFDRAQLGSDWHATSQSAWSIREGRLRVANARNHPAWLRRKLPRNARIEFDAWSHGPAGDIKCEVYGDGRSYATEDSYTATSYVVIFGGWNNQLNVIARMDEHAPDRRVRRGPPVVQDQRYHFAIERRGNVLSWSLDGSPMLEWDDPEPLAGPNHEYFAFNNWMVELEFDNLVITPL